MSEFETWSTYANRQKYLAEKRKAAPPPAPEPASYIEQRQQEAEQNKNPILGAVLTGMSVLEKPAAAVRGFLGTPEDRMGGAGRGFMAPETAPTGFDLTGGGFGLSRDNMGPLPFSPADVAGRAAEVALDPLTFVPYGGFVKAAKAPFQAAKTLMKPISAVDETAGLPALLGPAEQLARNTQATAGRAVGGVLDKIPLPGGRKVSEFFSPRAMDQQDDLGAFLRAAEGAADNVRSWVETSMAPFRSLRVKDGPNAIGDAMEGTLKAPLSIPGLTAQRIAQRKIQSGEQLWDQAQQELAAAAPELAKKYKVEWLADYFPRVMVKEQNGERIYRTVGSKRGMQNERAFDTRAEGEAAGFKYLSDEEALAHHLQDVGAKITEMRMLTELAKSKWATVGKFSPPRTDAGLHELEGTRFNGLWFEKGDAEQIGKYLQREDVFKKSTDFGPSIAHAGSRISDLRTLVAAGDISFAFLQNLPVLARNPAVGLANIGLGIRAFVQPEFRQKWLAQPEVQATLGRYAGLQVGGAEITAEGASRIPLVGKLVSKTPGVVGVLQRSQASWDMMGDASRVLMAQAMDRTVTKAAAELGENVATGQAADFLNHATGVTSTRAMGVGPGQRAAEDMMLFAPRYLRASLAVVGDTLGGDVSKPEALKTLASMAVAGAWWYQRVSDMMNPEDDPAKRPIWDPSDGRFMTVDIEGNRVGVGGTYRSLMNLMGKVAKHPTDLLEINALDPENKNPLLRFWRGRSSIPVSKAWDIVTGETYMGSPIDRNFGGLARWTVTNFLPFAVGGLIEEEGKPEQKAVQFGASLVGARAFPETRTDIRDRLAQRDFGKSYDELDLVQQAEVRAKPEMKEIPISPGVRGDRDRQVQTIQTDWKGRIEQAAADVAAGKETGEGFRKRAAAASAERRARFKDVPEFDGGASGELIQNRDKYYSLLEKGAYDRTDFDTAQAFLEGLDPNSRKFIEDTNRASLAQLEPAARQMVEELRAAQDRLREYRDLTKDALKRVPGLYERYQDATPVEREQIEASVQFKRATARADVQRQLMRRRNPEIDAALVTWYGLKPIRGR